MIKHLGIIMDGNRRWAKKRLLPSAAGHLAGADNVEKIAIAAKNKGIKYVTFWGLSTDNLQKRDSKEVSDLIKIINGAEKYLEKIISEGGRIKVIGNISQLPQQSQEVLNNLIEKTKNNSEIIITLALVYGGQDEIIRATRKIIQEGIKPENLTKQEFRKYTDLADYPVVDLIVRTGGDIRHSGFLLFDSEYAEYYFTDKGWPAYNEKELDKTIEFFMKSKRNFGK